MSEHQNIEYKQSWRDEYLKWICGFANAQGGKIIIGADDEGNITGIDDYKKLMEDIPNKAINHLGLAIQTNLHTQNKKHYIEISVQPSDVAISYHGVYHYRSGSTKQELKGAALQQFLLKKFGKSWDEMIIEDATIKEDIDLDALKRFIKEALKNQRIPASAANDNTETLLASLHLTKNKTQLKAAAILLFGKDPLKYFTHAYFKIGRFGEADHDLKFHDVIEGNIFDMPDKVIDILRKKYLASPIHYEGLLRKEILEYPEIALREAILNAIVHKNYAGTTIQLRVYDDKLTLWNQGILPEEMTIEQLKQPHSSHPRNTNIADTFFKAGYIEEWGRGISKIMDACKNAGLPEPLIQETQGGIQITFLKDIYTAEQLAKMGLNERQIKALLFIKQEGSISNTQYQQITETSKRTATRDLQEILDKQLVQKQGFTGKGTSYTLYRK